jgi:uncharacterized protein YidB (DUF937 family)
MLRGSDFRSGSKEETMGILDSLGPLKGLLGQVEETALPGLISEGLAKTGLGDLQGLMNKLQEGGLSTQVQSWLGDGQNLSIDPDSLKGVLEEEHVQQLAQHFGVDPDAVLKLLAEHLPTAVDQARQQGTVGS